MRIKIRKNMNHFIEEPWIYKKIRLKFEKWLDNLSGNDEAAKIIDL